MSLTSDVDIWSTTEQSSCAQCGFRHAKESPRSHIWWYHFLEHTSEDIRKLRSRLETCRDEAISTRLDAPVTMIVAVDSATVD